MARGVGQVHTRALQPCALVFASVCPSRSNLASPVSRTLDSKQRENGIGTQQMCRVDVDVGDLSILLQEQVGVPALSLHLHMYAPSFFIAWEGEISSDTAQGRPQGTVCNLSLCPCPCPLHFLPLNFPELLASPNIPHQDQRNPASALAQFKPVTLTSESRSQLPMGSAIRVPNSCLPGSKSSQQQGTELGVGENRFPHLGWCHHLPLTLFKALHSLSSLSTARAKSMSSFTAKEDRYPDK